MVTEEKTVSVPEAAALIGITRSTVNHWISTKQLHAKRSGRNYSVPVKELLFFLKSTVTSDSDLSGKDFYWKIVSLVTKETLKEHRTKILFGWLPFYGSVFLFLVFVSLGLSLAVTLRKQVAEERLRREKFQGVLEMAGAICHEINQPMQAISGYSELLLMDLPEDNSLYSNLQKIKGHVDRTGKITSKLTKITRYETKSYLKGKIVDIDKAAKSG